ncbi:MAG: TMEM165/GDT1 family protein [Actinomycetota bacterium]|jgi:putative Ca2+/H+ antiporter (TMEM165/GDT1 family)|nr:TMEM165/GDT1 family protein [Actinomycetota bacterium]
MNLGLAATTFALVLPAELPDKTFIATIVMSSRQRPLPVWIGTAAGLVLQAAIAVAAGRLLALLPHRTVEGIVAGLFLLGGAYLLLIPQKKEEEGAKAIGIKEEARMGEPPVRSLKVALTAFSVVALAEFGDLTQVIVANFTARTKDPLSVFVGAAVAFIVISGVGVLAGRTLVRYVPLSLIRRLSGLLLCGLGVYSILQAA